MKFSRLLFALVLVITFSSCEPTKTEQDKETAKVVEPSASTTPLPTPERSICEFTLGFDAWEPYQYADVGGVVSGLDIELIEAVVDAMDCKLVYQQGSWVELLKALRQGDVDILLGASKTAAREKFALFSDPYRMEEFSLYIRKDDNTTAKYQTLKEFVQNQSKIGLVDDYFYGPEVTAMLEDPSTSEYFVGGIMGEMNVARLLDGDIDGFIEDSFVGASLIRRKALSNYIVAHGITIETGNAYVMFSQKSVTQEQLEVFNQHLADVKSSDIYQQVLSKYAY